MSLQFDQSEELDTWEQKEQFRKLEAAVQNGLSYWREAADALLQIRDKKLYRLSNFSSFKSYVETRWSMAHTYAYRLIQATETAAEIEKTYTQVYEPSTSSSTIIPRQPAVLNALSPLPAEERAAVYVQAVQQNGGHVPTVAQVAQTVAQSTSERIGRLDTDRTAKPPPPVKATPPRQRFGHGFRLWNFKYDADNGRIFAEVFKPAVPNRYEQRSEKVSLAIDDLEWELGKCGFRLVPKDAVTVAPDDTDSADEDEEDDLPGPFTAGRDWSALDALTLPPKELPVGMAEQAMNLMFADDYPQ